jgi:hypothetical protein
MYKQIININFKNTQAINFDHDERNNTNVTKVTLERTFA